MINLKNSIYVNTPADIYIIDNGRTSADLVNSIYDRKIFDKIHYIRHYPQSKTNNIIQKLPKNLWKVITFISTIINYIHYQYIFHTENERTYDTFFLSGLWGDSGYFLAHYLKYNLTPVVYFVEEGVANYKYTITELCYQLESLHPMACLLWKLTTGRDKASDIRRIIPLIKGVYLYNPNNYLPLKEKPLLKIPTISNKLTLEILSETISPEIYERYCNSDIIYFMQDQTVDMSQYNILCQYLSEISWLTNLKMIIKQHPSFTLDNKKTKNISEIKNSKIDSDNYLLEGIYAKTNLDSKILITRDSSAVMYPRYMFAKEPFIILTYKLYPDYYSKHSKFLDNYAQNLIKSYMDKSKIYVPKSISDLKDFLRQNSFKGERN